MSEGAHFYAARLVFRYVDPDRHYPRLGATPLRRP
jgi:hypothetical protein